MIVAAIAGFIAVVLFYVLLLKPVGASISEAQQQYRDAQTQESQLRAQLRQLQEAKRTSTDVQARLAKFELLLPRTADLPAFIRQVQGAANESSIDLTSLAPSPPAPVATGPGVDPAFAGKGVFTVNVVLSLQGGFFRIKSFLQRLETLQRVVQIGNITLAPAVDPLTGLTVLQSTLTLTMFVVNPNLPVPGATPVPAAPNGLPSSTPSSGAGGPGGPATPAPTPSR